jgi:hypothetical protein
MLMGHVHPVIKQSGDWWIGWIEGKSLWDLWDTATVPRSVHEEEALMRIKPLQPTWAAEPFGPREPARSDPVWLSVGGTATNHRRITALRS